MSEKFYCEASVYRGEWSTIRTEPCNKPGKGHKRCSKGHEIGLCGIHLRAKYVLHWQDRNSRGSPAGWVE